MDRQPELTLLAGGACGSDDCPTVFMTDRGSIAVQGDKLDRKTPDGEAIVEIPRGILIEAARALA